MMLVFPSCRRGSDPFSDNRSCQNKASGLALSALKHNGNARPDVPFSLLLFLSL